MTTSDTKRAERGSSWRQHRAAALQLDYVEHSEAHDARSKTQHRSQLTKFCAFLRIALLLLAPLHTCTRSSTPCTRSSHGPSGLRSWSARSGIHAAQRCCSPHRHAAVDSCPMGGFNPAKIAKILGLPRGSAIPIVIALGHLSCDTHIEPRWRRRFDGAVVNHD